MEHQSVYFLSHHMRYKDNKKINDIKQLDNDIIPIGISSLSQDYNTIYTALNTDYISNINNNTRNNSLAFKILHLAYRLRLAFEARVREKDVCCLVVKYEPTSNSIIGLINNKSFLTADQQFNLYLYLFNENSSVLIVNNDNYKSQFRNLINITLDVMKNYV